MGRASSPESEMVMVAVWPERVWSILALERQVSAKALKWDRWIALVVSTVTFGLLPQPFP